MNFSRRNFIFGLSATTSTIIFPNFSSAKIKLSRLEVRLRNNVLKNADNLVGIDQRNKEQREFLKEYFQTYLNRYVDPVETPWCAAYVDAVLAESGLPRMNTLWARDFLKYGVPVNTPVKGDIAVFSRKISFGHVGFYLDMNEDYVQILNGNANGQVGYSNYPRSKLLGFTSYIDRKT